MKSREIYSKCRKAFFLISAVFQNSKNRSPNIWATFVRELVDKKFQKSPNLVTLQSQTTSMFNEAVSSRVKKRLFVLGRHLASTPINAFVKLEVMGCPTDCVVGTSEVCMVKQFFYSYSIPLPY